jgi:catechol 2,3-dioxygenase-like lactoylglutathione lyase family enzyme
MLDHISIPVSDFARAAAFYDAVLATVGYRRMKERDGAIGYGHMGEGHPPVFWILQRQDGSAAPGIGLHISFRAKDRNMVHGFHTTALAKGGTDAGAPGPRPQYTAGFYGAFVFDPDGYKIEAVVREALPQSS